MTAPFSQSTLAGGDAVPVGSVYDRVADIPIRLSVEAGSARLPLAALLALDQGAIVELDRLADDPLDILANGKLIARGEIVTVGDRLAVRITDIVDSGTGRAQQGSRTS